MVGLSAPAVCVLQNVLKKEINLIRLIGGALLISMLKLDIFSIEKFLSYIKEPAEQCAARGGEGAG